MKNHKLLIGIVLLAIIALGAYLYFSRGKTSDTPASTGTLASSNNGANPVAIGTQESASAFAGSDIAMMLKNISQIKLNTAILSNPSFVALTDTSISLPPAALSGRVNPFKPVGAAATSTVVNPSSIPTSAVQ